MIRVGLDWQSTWGQPTGIGSYTLSLARALRAGGDVEVVPLDWGRERVMRVDRRLRWQQWHLPLLARTRRVDLLHVTGFDAPLWQPVPTVVSVHDLIGMVFPGNLPPVARWYWSRWLPWSVRHARHIITGSEATKRDIQRLLGVEADRVVVIYDGVDERFSPQPPDAVAAVRQRYKVPDGRVILYVGTIEPRKGIDTLLDAWAQIASALPDTTLVIAGKEGWATAALHAQERALGIERRVCWTGYVADADLAAVYAMADVFVFPSRYEGFGLPPLEAMACGVPVISSDASSLPEVVGDAGVLVSPDDADGFATAIKNVLAQPNLAATLRERGLGRARLLTWERTAAQTYAVYKKMMEDQ
jgi:glycosyltransferase involved in cell wall biosynthesis